MIRHAVVLLVLVVIPLGARGQSVGIGLGLSGVTTNEAAADRGRLVVACDMRSDTCSDGRRIATVRATPVPCEVSPGVWEMVPEDTGCYGVRGLESWAATTSYLSYGAELDRSPWGPSIRGGSLTPIEDGWRVFNNPLDVNSGWNQRIPVEEDNETWTTSYIIRTWYPLLMAFYAGSSQSCGLAIRDTGPKWATFSCTRQVPKPSDPAALIYPGATDTGASHYVDVKAAWTVKGSTPGRPCWGGEAPVTCAADRHTISTEGWPTESGEISLTFSPGPSDNHQYIIDGRASGDTAGKTLLLVERQQKRLRFDIVPGQGTTGPILEVGKWYALKILVRDGRTRVLLDGVEVINVAGTPQFASTATLGNRFELDEALNGSIRSLRIRSFE